MFDDDRTSRMRRLPEVGEAGQRRIAASTMEVRGTEGAIVETEYLHRAGVERVSLVPRLEPERFPHAEHFRFAACSTLAAGSWRALAKLRRALGLEGS